MQKRKDYVILHGIERVVEVFFVVVKFFLSTIYFNLGLIHESSGIISLQCCDARVLGVTCKWCY